MLWGLSQSTLQGISNEYYNIFRFLEKAWKTSIVFLKTKKEKRHILAIVKKYMHIFNKGART